MSAPKVEGTWTPLSKALERVADECRAAERLDLMERVSTGHLRYRYRYPSDPPGTYRYDPLPEHFFQLGRQIRPSMR